MECNICGKEKLWLIFIGKDSVCSNCIAKHTVFKEVRNSDERMLRKAIRAFDIIGFEQLKKVTNGQVDELAMGLIKAKNRPTVKFKKNNESSVKVDKEDSLDPLSEQDEFW